MGKITISSPENTPALLTRDAVTNPAIRPKLSEGDLGTYVSHYHRAGPDQLNLFQVIMEPNAELSPTDIKTMRSFTFLKAKCIWAAAFFTPKPRSIFQA